MFRETKATSGKNDQRKLPCTVVMLGSIVQGKTAAKARAEVNTNPVPKLTMTLPFPYSNPNSALTLF